MGVVPDILATWRRPGRVLGRLLSGPPQEGRALAVLMGACALMFVAQWPGLARKAHLEGTELQPLLGGALMATLFLLPLVFYALALLAHAVTRAFGGQGTAYGARLALFWALLAASPLVLLNGLVAGFVGPGPALSIVGFAWVVVFGWFWIAGMRRVGWGE